MQEVARVENHPPLRKNARGGLGRKRRRRNDVAADGNQPPLKRRRGVVGVAVRGDENVPRADLAGFRINGPLMVGPPGASPRHFPNSRVLGDEGARALCSGGESVNVLGGVESTAVFVQKQAVVAASSELRPLVGLGEETHPMAEDSGEKRLLLFECLEVTRLGSSLQVPGPLEVAVNSLLGHDGLQGGDGVLDTSKAGGPWSPRTGDQGARLELEASQDLSCVPELHPTRPSPVEDHDRGSAWPTGAQPITRIPGTQNGHVEPVPGRTRDQGLGPGDYGLPPIRMALNGRYSSWAGICGSLCD